MENSIRVVVADDHPLVRAGLRLFVESDQDLTVVGEADSGEGAIAAVLCYRPDVLLLDSQMPDSGGVELIRSVKHADSTVRILALTTFPDDMYARVLLKAGAEGCLSKCADCDALLRALKAVAAGDCRTEAGSEAPVYRQRRSVKGHKRSDVLTQRELDILKLASRGLHNREIGVELGLSHRTVQGYLASAYHRLHARSRTQAVTRAVQLGLIRPE